MEVLRIAHATFQHVSYLVTHHPFYSVLGSVVFVCLLLHLYCRLSVGMCNIEQDMSGKTVLITGASGGIGKCTAMDLARRKARLILASRDVKKANKVAEEIKLETGNENIVVKYLDLTSFESVRKCAQSVLETEERLHVLINNAGRAGMSRQKLTEDGCELLMQTNHLGHFLLTLLLLDILIKSSPSRIINVSSDAHHTANFDVNDLNNKRRIHPMSIYSNTKLANILFTKELAERLRGTGVTVNALHPGVVDTSFMSNVNGFIGFIVKIFLLLVYKSPEEGAQTTIQLAVDPRLEKTTGKYFKDCKKSFTSKAARDKNLAKLLFEKSEHIVGVTFDSQMAMRINSEI